MTTEYVVWTQGGQDRPLHGGGGGGGGGERGERGEGRGGGGRGRGGEGERGRGGEGERGGGGGGGEIKSEKSDERYIECHYKSRFKTLH